MRLIAGAVLVLAGAVVIAGGMVTEAVLDAAKMDRSGRVVPAILGLTGLVMMVLAAADGPRGPDRE